MRRQVLLGLGPVFAVFLVAAVPTQALAQAPPFETRKITENVYIFRYVGHQSMFVVTPDGVIATDPIGYLRPQAVTTKGHRHVGPCESFSNSKSLASRAAMAASAPPGG